MKKVFYLFATAMMVLFASCGDKGVQPADPAITYADASKFSGEYEADFQQLENVPLDGCFEIQSVTTAMVPWGTEFAIKATVNLKMIKAPAEKIDLFFGEIQLLDENGTVLETCTRIEGIKDLAALSEGGIGILTGDSKSWKQEDTEEMLKKIKFIRLSGFAGGKVVEPEPKEPEPVVEEVSSSSDSYSDPISDAASEISRAQSAAAAEISRAQQAAAEEISKAQQAAAEEMRKAQKQAADEMRKAMGY